MEQDEFCKLKAEAKSKLNGQITGYDITNKNNRPQLDIKINVGKKYFYITLNEYILSYFIKKYDISCINDFIDLKLDINIISENKIEINNAIQINATKYSFGSKQKYKDNIEKINNIIKELKQVNDFKGEQEIVDVNSYTINNNTYTVVTVSNGLNTLDFELEHPLFYDNDNLTIQFINKYGNGYEQGLLNTKIKIKDISEIKEYDKIVSVTESLAIYIPVKNNKNDLYTYYTLIAFTFISSVFISISIVIFGYIMLSLISLFVTGVLLAITKSFKDEYLIT